MDLKVVFGIVCLWVLAITSSNAGIPKCCISTRAVPPFVQRKVIKWERQYSNGVCDIDALRLYVTSFKKPICADPTLMKDLKKNMEKARATRMRRQRAQQH